MEKTKTANSRDFISWDYSCNSQVKLYQHHHTGKMIQQKTNWSLAGKQQWNIRPCQQCSKATSAWAKYRMRWVGVINEPLLRVKLCCCWQKERGGGALEGIDGSTSKSTFLHLFYVFKPGNILFYTMKPESASFLFWKKKNPLIWADPSCLPSSQDPKTFHNISFSVVFSGNKWGHWARALLHQLQV